MEKEFEKIEKGMELLKKEFEKIEKDVSFADEFLKLIKTGKENRITSFGSFKLSFIYLAIFLLFVNLFLVIHKLSTKKESYVSIEKEIKEIPISIQEIPVKEPIIERKNVKKKKVLVANEREVKEEKILTSESFSIEDTIIFTEEINKILKLFTINFKLEVEHVEI